MLATTVSDISRARANPVERTSGSVKRNLVDSSAARACDSKAKLVAFRVGIGRDRITRSLRFRNLDNRCFALDLRLCHDFTYCAESLVLDLERRKLLGFLKSDFVPINTLGMVVVVDGDLTTLKNQDGI